MALDLTDVEVLGGPDLSPEEDCWVDPELRVDFAVDDDPDDMRTSDLDGWRTCWQEVRMLQVREKEEVKRVRGSDQDVLDCQPLPSAA